MRPVRRISQAKSSYDRSGGMWDGRRWNEGFNPHEYTEHAVSVYRCEECGLRFFSKPRNPNSKHFCKTHFVRGKNGFGPRPYRFYTEEDEVKRLAMFKRQGVKIIKPASEML